MRLVKTGLVVSLFALLFPAAASARHVTGVYPDCVSSVPVASSGFQYVGEIKSHGWGGGFIGTIPLPYVQGVTPAPSAVEADVVGALLDLDFLGVLGGGATTLRPLGGIGGGATTHTGAQVVTALVFTGHFKAEPRFMYCDSVVRPNTIIRWSYFEITLTGLLTPTGIGSPLQQYAIGLQLSVLPGDNSPT